MGKLNYICGVISIVFIFSCHKPNTYWKEYITENVIIIVMDGARYSETWGDTNHTHIPNLSNNIAPFSVTGSNFYNDGFTWTTPGHLAILSGKYYNLNNGGGELPPFPTIFQYFNKSYPNKNSWLITSKDKLEVLTNTSDVNFNNLYLANTDCGINGLGTGYREDSVTFHNTINILSTEQPNLVLINFKDPDSWGHANNWANYIESIEKTDDYVYQLFNFIQNSTHYSNKTTIFITNDHGRHDDLNGGFVGHGDSCEGCRHLMFFAYGPDFYQNQIVNSHYEQIDIATTIAELLHFHLPNSDGQVMGELFK
jgi:hypothetical protein